MKDAGSEAIVLQLEHLSGPVSTLPRSFYVDDVLQKFIHFVTLHSKYSAANMIPGSSTANLHWNFNHLLIYIFLGDKYGPMQPPWLEFGRLRVGQKRTLLVEVQSSNDADQVLNVVL